MKSLRDLLCRLICGGRVFNSDMSLETDRLTVENEQVKKENQELKEIIRKGGL